MSKFENQWDRLKRSYGNIDFDGLVSGLPPGGSADFTKIQKQLDFLAQQAGTNASNIDSLSGRVTVVENMPAQAKPDLTPYALKTDIEGKLSEASYNSDKSLILQRIDVLESKPEPSLTPYVKKTDLDPELDDLDNRLEELENAPQINTDNFATKQELSGKLNVGAYDSQVNELQTKIQELQNKQDPDLTPYALKTDLNAKINQSVYDEEMDLIDNRIATLESKPEVNLTNYALKSELNSKVNTTDYQTQISSITDDIQEISNRPGPDLSAYATKTDLNAKENIGAYDTQISSINSKITTLQNANYITPSQLTAVTNTLATGADLASLDGRVGFLESLDLGIYATTADVNNSLLTKVNTNDSRLSDARTPLAHVHAISEVTSLQTSLNSLNNALFSRYFTDKVFSCDRLLVTSAVALTVNTPQACGVQAVSAGSATALRWCIADGFGGASVTGGEIAVYVGSNLNSLSRVALISGASNISGAVGVRESVVSVSWLANQYIFVVFNCTAATTVPRMASTTASTGTGLISSASLPLQGNFSSVTSLPSTINLTTGFTQGKQRTWWALS